MDPPIKLRLLLEGEERRWGGGDKVFRNAEHRIDPPDNSPVSTRSPDPACPGCPAASAAALSLQKVSGDIGSLCICLL